MSARIPPLRKKKIIISYLTGYDEGDVAKREKERASTVKKEVSNFEKIWDKKGMWAAAEEYDVTETVTQLHGVAVAMLERKLSPSDMAAGAGVALALKGVGVEGERAEKFVEEVLLRFKAKGQSAARVADDCSEIARLEKKHGKGFDEIRSEYEMMGSRVPVLKEQQQKLSKQCEEKRKELADLFERHDAAKKDLEQFVATRDALAALGIGLSSLDDLTRVMAVLKEQGFDTEKVAEKLKSIEGLESQEGDLKASVAGLEEDIDSLKKKKVELDETTKKKEKLVNEIWKYEETGLTHVGVHELRNLVVQVSANHGLSSSEAMKKLQDDLLKHYDTLLGLEPVVKSLEERKKLLDESIAQEIENASQSLKVASAKLAEANHEHAKKAEEILAYAKLRDRGVTDDMITAWTHLLDDANMSADSLWSEVKSLADLETLKERKSTELKETEERHSLLSSELAEITKKREAMEEEYEAEKEAIAAFESAKKEGADLATMTAWGKALEGSNLSPSLVAAELKKYGNMSDILNEQQKRVSELEKQQSALSENLGRLTTMKAQMQKEMEEIVPMAAAELKSYVAKLEETSQEMSSKAEERIKSMDEAAVSAVSAMRSTVVADMKAIVKSSSDKLDSLAKDVEQTYLRAREVGEEIGRLEALRPVLHFMSAGEAEPLELLAFGTHFADRLQGYAEQKELSKVELAAGKLKEALKAELK